RAARAPRAHRGAGAALRLHRAPRPDAAARPPRPAGAAPPLLRARRRRRRLQALLHARRGAAHDRRRRDGGDGRGAHLARRRRSHAAPEVARHRPLRLPARGRADEGRQGGDGRVARDPRAVPRPQGDRVGAAPPRPPGLGQARPEGAALPAGAARARRPPEAGLRRAGRRLAARGAEAGRARRADAGGARVRRDRRPRSGEGDAPRAPRRARRLRALAVARLRPQGLALPPGRAKGARRVSARRPWLPALAFAALWLFVFTVPWEDSVLLPGIGTASRFAGLVAFAVGLASVARKGGVALRRPAAFLLPFALLCVWTVLSIEWAPDRGDGIAYAATLVQLFLMSWLVWQQCRDATDRRRLMQAYVLGCYVSVASTVAQYLSGNAFAGSAQERFAAAGFNPNYLASTLALGIPLAWHLVLSGRSRVVALLNFLAIPAVLVAIVLTGSRGGLITAVLALSVVPLTYAKL